MIKFLKSIKLPPSDRFIIKTVLSKEDVISKMTPLTERMYKFQTVYWGKFSTPKFAGKISEFGFEVALIRDCAAYRVPVFIPPTIKVNFTGSDPVSLEASLYYSKLHKAFFAIFKGFAMVWLCLWILALPLGLLFGVWENSQKIGIVAAEPIIVNPDNTLGFTELLILYFLPIIIIPIVFLFGPKYLANRSMQRSKLLLYDLFKPK